MDDSPADLPVLEALPDLKLRCEPVGRMAELEHLLECIHKPLQAGELVVLYCVPCVHMLVPFACVSNADQHRHNNVRNGGLESASWKSASGMSGVQPIPMQQKYCQV